METSACERNSDNSLSLKKQQKMKTILSVCAVAAAACILGCAGAPPRRHVYWDRPHSSLPSWYPPQGPTFIQKVYYTLISHFGSAVAAGFGSFFGPLGPFVSSYSQPYLSTYVSRLTGDVVARSLGGSRPRLVSRLPAPPHVRAHTAPPRPSTAAGVPLERLNDDAGNFIDQAPPPVGDKLPTLLKDKSYEDCTDDHHNMAVNSEEERESLDEQTNLVSKY